MASTIFEGTFNKVDTALATYITDVTANVITAITPVVTTLLLIYMAMWGWKVATGSNTELITDGFNRLIKLTIIVTIAINVGYYNTFVVNFLTNLPDRLAALASITATTNTGTFLDGVFDEMWNLGWLFANKASAESSFGIADLPLTFAALAVWGFGILLTVFGAFLLILSKMALSVLIGVGPIFIILLMFESTKRFFEAWMQQCFNFIFIVMLAGGILRLVISILTAYLTAYDASVTGVDVELQGAFPAIILSGIAFLILKQVMPIASGLGGGIALNAMNAGRSIPDKLKEWDQQRMQRNMYQGNASTSGQQIAAAKNWAGGKAQAITDKLKSGNTVTKSK